MTARPGPRSRDVLPRLAGLGRRFGWLLAVGVVLDLGYSLAVSDRQVLQDTLRLDPAWLAVSVLLAMLPLAAGALRIWLWGRLLQPGFRLRSATRIIMLTEVTSAVTPSAVGGAPVKIAALASYGLGTAGGTALALLGTLEDTLAILLLVPAAALATGLLPRLLELMGGLAHTVPASGLTVGLAAAVAAGLAVAAVIGTRLLTRGRRGRRRLVRLRRWRRDLLAVAGIVRRRGKRVLAINTGLAVVHWAARLSIISALAAGLGAPVPPVRTAVLQWLCFTGMNLAPTPGAVGGAEAMFILTIGRELPSALVPLAMTSWRFVTFYCLNLSALFLLLGPLRTVEGAVRAGVPGRSGGATAADPA
ncbi:MAG: flippase-like domain-containing protein [bacterium]|nr:flippase-like domain-containing protein [bacterium]